MCPPAEIATHGRYTIIFVPLPMRTIVSLFFWGSSMALKFFLTAAAVLSVAVPAQAADLSNTAASYKDTPYLQVPAWTGFYMGVNAGYGWNVNNAETVLYSEFGSDGGGSFERKGAFGGGQIGYNLQRGSVVAGIEADIQYSNIGGAGSSAGSAAMVPTASQMDYHGDLNWFGTARARLGYAFDRNTLAYVTGGLAFGEVEDRANSKSGVFDGPISIHETSTEVGYVVGGGIERMLGDALSVKLEYQYIDLGSKEAKGVQDRGPVSEGGEGYWPVSVKRDHTFNTVRVGLNYKFGERSEPLK